MTAATTKKNELIDALAGRKIAGDWRGDELACVFVYKTAKGTTATVRWSIVFDDAEELAGPRVQLFGEKKYADAVARIAFFESIRVGRGDIAASAFVAECAAGGVFSGAPQGWAGAA